MLPQQVLAESFTTPPVALHEKGVAAYQLATFHVTLMPVIDETMTVTEVKIVEFDRRPAQVAWAMGRPSECGGELYERGYSAHLDSTPITMRSDEYHSSGESVGFTVSVDDPAELGITIRGCGGMYEFGLEFHYRVRGTESVVRVGTEDAPLRLLGGEPAPNPEIALPRDDVFEVTADAAATLCEGGYWDAYVQPEGGEVTEEPVENPAPIDPDTLTDDDTFAEWERACAQLESTLSPIEHMSFGCAPGEDQAAWESACIKAEPLLTREQLALFCSGAR